MTKNVDYCL